MTTLVTVVEEVVTLAVTEGDETISIAVGEPGPVGGQGEPGFTTGIDIINGGMPNTNYTNEYQFDGGVP